MGAIHIAHNEARTICALMFRQSRRVQRAQEDMRAKLALLEARRSLIDAAIDLRREAEHLQAVIRRAERADPSIAAQRRADVIRERAA